MGHPLVTYRIAAVLTAVTAVFGLQVTPAAAEQAPACYGLSLSALTGPAGADLTLQVDALTAECARPEALKKVQLKLFQAGGELADVRNLKDVPAPEGRASIDLGPLERGRRIEADVLVQAGDPSPTFVLRAETVTLQRPDLAVTAVQAPTQTLTVRPIDVTAEIGELNGDVGATATVSLSWGPSTIATREVTVPAGGRVSVTFAALALTTPSSIDLTVRVENAKPAETDATNNERTTTVDVTEFELARSRLLVDNLGGYGAQFNQHVYAKITPAPPGSLPELEDKVKALEPQLVRIFFHEIDELDADKMKSFIETVELAHQSGATINITYATTARARFQPGPFMTQFAELLKDLVVNRGFTNVRWVTIQNEPNLATNQITLAQYEALNRAIDEQLKSRALRQQIGIMAGDLVESTGARSHKIWFQYIVDHFADIVDAYSEHIYWNYWDIPRMQFRLLDVRRMMIENVPASARKPVYIMEYGIRGVAQCGKPTLDPGYWQPDCTPIGRTNVTAFQHLYFNILSAQLGFSGTSKWDAFWGKYNTGTQAFWMIGPPEEGFPLFPTYHALRLVLQTTARGWHVVGVDPWNDDDWKLDELNRPIDQPEKELAAYAGPNGELTLLGLDSHGWDLNSVSTGTRAYSLAGLPSLTRFNLGIWNAAGDGKNAIAAEVTTNAAGVARFEVPLHGAFALTTVPVD
jgi:hypothetical protein